MHSIIAINPTIAIPYLQKAVHFVMILFSMALNPEILILNTILEKATQGPLNETEWEIFREVQSPGTECKPFGHEDGVTLKSPGKPSPKGKLAHQRGTL